MGRRLTPNWYLYVIFSMLLLGFIVNTTMYVAQGQLLRYLNVFGLFFACFWIIFNAFMFTFFLVEKYELKALVLPAYFVLINVLNLLNFLFQWYTNYNVLIFVSYGTKVLEVIFAGSLLMRNWKKKR